MSNIRDTPKRYDIKDIRAYHDAAPKVETREDTIFLANLAIEELDKINKILDTAFEKCEMDLKNEARLETD
jgi:hypothetical protein